MTKKNAYFRIKMANSKEYLKIMAMSSVMHKKEYFVKLRHQLVANERYVIHRATIKFLIIDPLYIWYKW